MTANIDEIDNVFGANNIVNVWKKYVGIYNMEDFRGDKIKLCTRLYDDCGHNVNEMRVSNSAVICALDKLQVGRTMGSSGKSAELLKMYCAEANAFIGDAFLISFFILGILRVSSWKLSCVQFL